MPILEKVENQLFKWLPEKLEKDKKLNLKKVEGRKQ